MAKVTESERIWKSIDRLERTVFGQSENIATLSANQKNICKSINNLRITITNHQIHKDRKTLAIVGIIGAVITGVNIAINYAQL